MGPTKASHSSSRSSKLSTSCSSGGAGWNQEGDKRGGGEGEIGEARCLSPIPWLLTCCSIPPSPTPGPALTLIPLSLICSGVTSVRCATGPGILPASVI